MTDSNQNSLQGMGRSQDQGQAFEFQRELELLILQIAMPAVVAAVAVLHQGVGFPRCGRLSFLARKLTHGKPGQDGQYWCNNKCNDYMLVGEKHLKLQLQHMSSGISVDAIAFNKDSEVLPVGGKNIRAVYRMDVNEFRGSKNLQLIVEHIEAA